MGIVTRDEVCKRLNAQIKANYEKLLWIGIKTETIYSIEKVETDITDNSFYSGNGNYNFSGIVSFMVNTVFNDNNEPIGRDLKRYSISPSCKLNIQEINNDLNIEIIEPIQVTPHY